MKFRWDKKTKAYWKRTLKFYDLGPKELSALRKELIIAQRFLCALCGKNLSGKPMFMDHDHHSGLVRGMLCFYCNRFRVAKNTRETSLAVVRYLSNPPAPLLIETILPRVREMAL